MKISIGKVSGIDRIPVETLIHGVQKPVRKIPGIVPGAWAGNPIFQSRVDPILIFFHKGKGSESIGGYYGSMSILEYVDKIFY